jgi:phage terminase large subunit
MEVHVTPTAKQHEMFLAFDDPTTTEIVWGGAAGGGKSFGLCLLMVLKCLQHGGIRVGLARNQLTILKKTTLVSFLEVVDYLNIRNLVKINQMDGVVKFANGSEIVFIELSSRPGDPLYTRLGGLLLTFACIDELAETDEKGYNILKSRVGRWKNAETGIKPLLVSSTNPAKNWVFREFYEPFTTGNLKEHQQFIPALVTDNLHLPESYIKSLETLPFREKERLLRGNWSYEQTPDDLISYEVALAAFNPNEKIPEGATRWITADIAYTSDKCVVLVWANLIIEKVVVIGGDEVVEDVILELAKELKIPMQRVAYDSDGVGLHLKQKLRGAIAINNGGKVLKNENYFHLKDQMLYKLAEQINLGQVTIKDTKWQKEIVEELQVVRHYPHSGTKLRTLPKEQVKKILGHSPDFTDSMAYRMYFVINGESKKPATSFIKRRII